MNYMEAFKLLEAFVNGKRGQVNKHHYARLQVALELVRMHVTLTDARVEDDGFIVVRGT